MLALNSPPVTPDLFFDWVALIVMPLLIWSNLSKHGSASILNQYLWREHTSFMRVSMAILALVTLFAATSLLATYGLISSTMQQTLSMAIGIPFLVAALVMIALALFGLFRLARGWLAGGRAT